MQTNSKNCGHFIMFYDTYTIRKIDLNFNLIEMLIDHQFTEEIKLQLIFKHRLLQFITDSVLINGISYKNARIVPFGIQ